MLLVDFKQIQEIDQKILELQDIRTKLFNGQTDTQVTSANQPSQPTNSSNLVIQNDNRWAIHMYQELFSKWSRNGIKIPSYKQLEPKLLKANQILLEITSLRPELYDRMAAVMKMSVVLVPPTKIIDNFIAKDRFDSTKLICKSEDYKLAKLPKQLSSRGWKIVIAYNDSEGLFVDNLSQLINNKQFYIGDFDAFAMGVNEYVSLVLQENLNFDRASFTLLPKNTTSKTKVIPSVKYMFGTYIIGVESPDNIFGDVRFRPTIEIGA